MRCLAVAHLVVDFGGPRHRDWIIAQITTNWCSKPSKYEWFMVVYYSLYYCFTYVLPCFTHITSIRLLEYPLLYTSIYYRFWTTC